MPLPSNTPGWRSKAPPAVGKAHFILGSGLTACHKTSGPHGVAMGELLTCKWTTLDTEDHLCGLCRRAMAPRVLVQCLCGKCRPLASVKGKRNQ
jgi:hypothetical protein